MDWGGTLDAALKKGRWRRVDAILVQAAEDPDGLAACQAWYRTHRTLWTRRVREGLWSRDPESNHSACFSLLAVDLAPSPAKAAQWFGVGQLWWGSQEDVPEALVRHLVDRGPAWCATFLDAAGALDLRLADGFMVSSLATLTLPVIDHFELPAPLGGGFAISWAAHYAWLASQARWEQRYADSLPRPAEPMTHLDVVVGADGRPRGRTRQIGRMNLLDELRADPVLAPVLHTALATPGAFAPLENLSCEGWELGPALAALAAEGRLNRTAVIDDALELLTRAETPAAQKAVARLLDGLDLSPADLRARVPLAQGLMATARGPVTAALLGPLLEAVEAGDDLVELAITVFSRKEKAQQTTLLRALLAQDAEARWGRDAVVAALQVAADVPDERLAGRARERLGQLGGRVSPPATTAPAADGLWLPLPDPDPPTPLDEIPPTEADILTAAAGRGDLSPAVAQSLVLDAVVRWAAADTPAALRFLTDVREREGAELLGVLATLGYSRYLGARHQLGVRLRKFSEPAADTRGAELDTILGALVSLHQTETGLRLGDAPLLLSTPTQSDGTVSLDALVDRLRRHPPAPVSALDLLLALLRIGPVEPARVAELGVLDGRLLPLDAPVPRRQRLLRRLVRGSDTQVPDVVRQWVAAGGLPELSTHPDADGVPRPAPVHLPVPADAFPGLPGGRLAGRGFGDGSSPWPWSAPDKLAAVPWWPELAAAHSHLMVDQTSRNIAASLLPELVGAPGPAGPAVHRAVVVAMAHATEADRLQGVDAFLALARRPDFDAGLVTAACLDLLRSGQLRLARTTSAWEQVVLAGGMRALWPAVAAVVDAACAAPRKPQGLAELVAFYGRYAAADPAAVVPPSLATLAGAAGSSKAQLEARRTVDLVSQGPR